MNSLGNESVECFEDTMVMTVLIILAMEALTLLMKGWSGYPTYVTDNKKVTPTQEEIPVMKNFSNVFSEELSGLLP